MNMYTRCIYRQRVLCMRDQQQDSSQHVCVGIDVYYATAIGNRHPINSRKSNHMYEQTFIAIITYIFIVIWDVNVVVEKCGCIDRSTHDDHHHRCN